MLATLNLLERDVLGHHVGVVVANVVKAHRLACRDGFVMLSTRHNAFGGSQAGVSLTELSGVAAHPASSMVRDATAISEVRAIQGSLCATSDVQGRG